MRLRDRYLSSMGQRPIRNHKVLRVHEVFRGEAMTVVPGHFATRRQDLADLRDRILTLLYERSGTISLAEAVGILEIAK